jgi:hypothetical protein
MDSVEEPRRVTKADVPKAIDRIRDVWRGDPRHRSAWEKTIYATWIVALALTGPLTWHSGASVPLKSFESVLTFVVGLVIVTFTLVKLRFEKLG